VTVRVGEREEIGRRLADALGQRSPEVVAKVMGISRPRLLQILGGEVPNAWLYLARLEKDGINTRKVLRGD
jgi:hypothetical protein